jgi:CRISPR-associated exonuclease Cas4
MLGIRVEKGAIFHHRSRRRREVIVDKTLRQAVRETTHLARQLFKQYDRPAPTLESHRCKECSLHDLCQPELALAKKRVAMLHGDLFDIEKGERWGH